MRLLYVIQRYGPTIPGGAEAHCRAFATRLVARGHEVEVLTSCATDYVTWANAMAAGASIDEGVTVHRLSAVAPRSPDFERRSARVFGRSFPARVARRLGHPLPPPRERAERRWLAAQGPVLHGQAEWFAENSHRFDVIIFFTYLYATTVDGIAAVVGPPVVLHPTAHDEPPLRLSIYDGVMRAVDAFAFSTPEEEELVRRRFAVTTPGAQIGIGIDLETPGRAADFRRRHGIEAPYLLCIGRMDANKGTSDLAVTFARYKTANPGSLRLVLIGDPVSPPDVHPDIDVLGVVDDTDKHDALDGCVALVSPSYFESFAMVITEAWAYGRPVLVQGANDVLLGHVSRSHGGLSYRSDDEFFGAVNSLLAESGRRGELGAAGRTHAEAVFGWDAVLGRYEQLLSSVVADGRSA